MAGIYIHIPLCVQRCIYCDFYSGTDLTLKQEVVKCLSKELEFRKNYLCEEIYTIYFGGGTPSLLSGSDFSVLFDTLYTHFNISEKAEITMEANPDDLSNEYTDMLRQLPFNRISIGIQSFSDDELLLLRRRHSAEQAMEAVRRCKRNGFENISIDLMYGLPGQTIDSWKNSIQQAILLEVPHISAYHLTYEEGTALYKLMKQDRLKPVTEQLSLDMFDLLIDSLSEVGYEHYEISNFARPGMYSGHNTSYWKGIPYLGVGPSAHSFDIVSRQWNPASVHEWADNIHSGKIVSQKEDLDIVTRYNDYIITSLRTMWGISLDEIEKNFGKIYKEYCVKNAHDYIKNGDLVEREGNIKLSRRGLFISDGIMSDLLYVD